MMIVVNKRDEISSMCWLLALPPILVENGAMQILGEYFRDLE
jgi:hypothetical protein